MQQTTRRPLVLISVMLAMFIGAVEATIVSTAMPVIAADLGGFSRYSWVFSAYLLMSTVTVLIYGKLADLFGRKVIFTIGVSLFLIGSILCGFSDSIEQLIGFRLIQGLGAGAVMPIATTIIGDIYTGAERARIQGALSSVWGISAISGPAIGGLIVDTIGWPFVFWVNIPLGLLAVFGILTFLKEPKRTGKPTIDYAGAITMTLALSAALFWLVEGGQSFNRISLWSFVLIAIIVISSVSFVYIEKRAKEPMMPFSIWKNKTIFIANLVSFTTGIILIGLSTYLPTYVTGVMEQSAMIAGFTLTAMSIGWPIASSLSGFLLTKIGTFTTSLAGGISLVIGTVLFVFMNPESGPLWAAFSSFFVGVGMGLTSTAFIVAIQSSVGHEQRGVATAANMFMRNFGNTVGAALLGGVLNFSFIKYMDNKNTDLALDDVNQLLDNESRASLSNKAIHLLQAALDSSLQWVFLVALLSAIISLVFILGLPKGKENWLERS